MFPFQIQEIPNGDTTRPPWGKKKESHCAQYALVTESRSEMTGHSGRLQSLSTWGWRKLFCPPFNRYAILVVYIVCPPVGSFLLPRVSLLRNAQLQLFDYTSGLLDGVTVIYLVTMSTLTELSFLLSLAVDAVCLKTGSPLQCACILMTLSGLICNTEIIALQISSHLANCPSRFL